MVESLSTMSLLSKEILVAFFALTLVVEQRGLAQNPQPGIQTTAGSSADTAANADKKSPDPTPQVPPDSTRLETIHAKRADYPSEAMDKQLQGQVWIKILVSEPGTVEEAEIFSGDPILATAALDAVKKWTFKPFIKDGKPVKVRTKVPFDFAFNDKVSEQKAPDHQMTLSRPSVPQTTGDGPVPITKLPSGVMAGFLTHKVAPIYPEMARREHIQGVVVLQATISKEGRITNLTLISGPKELTESAIGAVQQWRYKPYVLNGEAVEVSTQVMVNYQLR